MLDVVIIGGGPAALSAALYLARGGRKVRVYERGQFGGDLNQIPELTNYPGYTGSGLDLAMAMRQQAEDAGAEFAYGECQEIKLSEAGNARDTAEQGKFALTIDDVVVHAETVLIASGSKPRALPVSTHAPVSYCALCEADFAKGKRVAVIGGADSAVQEALYLAPMVRELTIITHSQIKARPELRQRLAECENVKVLEQMEPTTELLDKFEYVFVFIGKDPATHFLHGLESRPVVKKGNKHFGLEIVQEVGLLDEKGYIMTGKKGCSAHQTAIAGLYAAGDVRSGSIHQVVTAAGDGAAAAIEILEKH